LTLLAAITPAWGGEVAAPYPRLFPGTAPLLAGEPETAPTPKTVKPPPRQAGKAAGASAQWAGLDLDRIRPDVVGAILGLMAAGAIFVVAIKGLETEN
jgi:hypothetical protein